VTDRTDQPHRPTVRGPWPEASEVDRIFDYGAPWCINAEGHPGPDDDYPDRSRHFPPYECRTNGLVIDAIDGITGPPCELEVYAAAAFRFGELREAASPDHTRVIFDCCDEASDTSPRFSVSLGDALRIAQHLTQVVRSVDNARRGCP
jgi:hypothetical protein